MNEHDDDLKVDQGNALILQQFSYPTQSPPGIFETPNDSAQGGVLSIFFLHPTRPLSVDVIDICAGDNEGVVITMFDSNGKARTIFVDAGYTSAGDGGVASWRR